MSEIAKLVGAAVRQELRHSLDWAEDDSLDDDIGRAAIAAMRKPTKAMVDAGDRVENPCDMCMGTFCISDEVWEAMLAEALK